MSGNDTENVSDQLDTIANAFNRDNDPLEEFEATFNQIDLDPFQLFKNDVLQEQGLCEDTLENYQRVFDQWVAFSAEYDRHPACPTESLVEDFARYYRDEIRNSPGTVRKKLYRLNRAYYYWQTSNSFPHPIDYNPFNSVLTKLNLSDEPTKDFPNISLSVLKDVIQNVTHIRDRPIICAQLKTSLRATEVCNIEIPDIHIQNSELQRFYPELGSHKMLNGHTNALYIPPKQNTGLPVKGRPGNKSQRPRIIPLDRELRKLLIRYLLIRPDTGTPWLFLSTQKHNQLNNEAVNNIWIDAFHPQYRETEQHRGITSHFGRHWFTTYWRVEKNLNRELIKYMRGDETSSDSMNGRSAIDDYIHTYYEDIEDLYREHIFSLGL